MTNNDGTMICILKPKPLSREAQQELHEEAQEILGRYLSVRMAHRKNYQRREALLATLETDVDLLSGKSKVSSHGFL